MLCVPFLSKKQKPNVDFVSKGANLCVPELGIKVPYKPGTCVILRGGDLDHFVRDFKGTRYFIIATNHESSRQYALRKMGDPRARPLPAPKPKSDSPQGGDKRRASDEALDFDTDELSEDSDDGGDFEAPCINHRTDEDDLPVYTNRDLHGPNVLYSSSSSEASSLD